MKGVRSGVLLLVILVSSCDGEDRAQDDVVRDSAAVESAPRATATASPHPAATSTTPTADTTVTVFRQDLHDELVAMFEQDQYYRTGMVPPGEPEPDFVEDWVRINRLQEIIGEVGWPTFDLVGAEGATGAWVIAQHADQNPMFQELARELLRAAVADGQGDPVELAYLDDRVRVNQGDEQVYGTQVRCRGGEPTPATPISDPDAVEELRAELGLDPLTVYYEDFALPCADEAADGVDLGG